MRAYNQGHKFTQLEHVAKRLNPFADSVCVCVWLIQLLRPECMCAQRPAAMLVRATGCLNVHNYKFAPVPPPARSPETSQQPLLHYFYMYYTDPFPHAERIRTRGAFLPNRFANRSATNWRGARKKRDLGSRTESALVALMPAFHSN